MYFILAFSISLLIAVLLSGVARRTIISTTILYLIAGMFIGSLQLPVVNQLISSQSFLQQFVTLAMLAVLFPDGMKVNLNELRHVWMLPARALFLGLPLTIGIIAIIAHLFAGLYWYQALLVGAVLSPTDPVIATSIIQPNVPQKLRSLINIESGLNDGLALPIILAILSIFGFRKAALGSWVYEVLLGFVLGLVIPWVISRLATLKPNLVTPNFAPLLGFSVLMLLISLSSLVHANEFIAAYAGGIGMATFGKRFRDSFLELGEPLAELLKLAAILFFGAVFSIDFLKSLNLTQFGFAILVLFLARPLVFLVILFRSSLTWRERLAAAWFGPRGFSSVVYALLLISYGIQTSQSLFALIAWVIVFSILLHSTTDHLLSNWVGEEKGRRLLPRSKALLPRSKALLPVWKSKKSHGNLLFRSQDSRAHPAIRKPESLVHPDREYGR